MCVLVPSPETQWQREREQSDPDIRKIYLFSITIIYKSVCQGKEHVGLKEELPEDLQVESEGRKQQIEIILLLRYFHL